MNYYLIGSYILAIMVFLATPGPVTVMVVNASSKRGFKAGFATTAGTNTASLILIAISFAVIQGVLTVSDKALAWLTLFGSLYLLYFAINMLRDSKNEKSTDTGSIGTEDEVSLDSKDNLQVSQRSEPMLSYFRQGFLIGISNPKDIVFFIAFFPLFFAVADSPILAMIVLTVIWVVLDYVILMAYSLSFAKITNTTLIHIINKISGVILLLVAIFGIYRTSTGLYAK